LQTFASPFQAGTAEQHDTKSFFPLAAPVMGAFDLTVMAWGVEHLYQTHKGKMKGRDVMHGWLKGFSS